MRFVSVARLVGLAIIVSTAACSDSCNGHRIGDEVLKGMAGEFAPRTGAPHRLRVFVDTSASMRGFALAATANRSGAGEQFQSILLGLDSLGEMVQSDPPTISGVGAAASPIPPPPVTLTRFGGTSADLEPSASLADLGFGRVPALPLGGGALSSSWRSRDCAASWGGAASVRANLDGFFSEDVTCLNPVFDEILKDRSGQAAYVVVTDADQAAPEGDGRCSSARNMGTVQARLQQWVRGGGAAAVIVFEISSHPWQAQAVGTRFCGCSSRLLFAYLMTPSAQIAESIFTKIAERWRGTSDQIAFIPLSPRPASEFAVSVEILGEEPAAIFDANSEHLTTPETGVLPTVHLKLSGDASVRFVLSEAAFDPPDIQRLSGVGKLDWTKAHFSWSDPQSIALSEEGQQPPFRAVPANSDLGFIRRADPTGGGAAQESRLGRYRAKPVRLDRDALLPSLTTAVFDIERKGGKGCEAYLIEVEGGLPDIFDQLTAGVPLVKKASTACLNLSNLRSQTQLIYRPGSVVRFLLHIDY